MAEDLYIFCYGLALLLLSVLTVGAMSAIWCIVVLYFKRREDRRHDEESEQTEDEKRRKRNAELIDKYLR